MIVASNFVGMSNSVNTYVTCLRLTDDYFSISIYINDFKLKSLYYWRNEGANQMNIGSWRIVAVTIILFSTLTLSAYAQECTTLHRTSATLSATITHRVYAVKDADDRPTGSDGELRIGREWGSTECWIQFDLNSIPQNSRVDNVTFWFYHTRTTYQENAIRMMGNDDWDWIEDGIDKPNGNWWPDALAWYDYGDAQMPSMWMGWNDTKTATMGLQYPFPYGPVTGHLTEYVNYILTKDNRNFTLVLRNIWGDGAGGSHYHASRESSHPPFLEFAYIYTLTINSSIGGSTDPVAGSYTHAEDEIVSITAIPEADYYFDHWQYNGQTSSANPISLTMDKDYVLTPIFYLIPTKPSITEVTRIPSSPSYHQEVKVTAKITDDIAVDEALLAYTKNDMWHNISMTGLVDEFSATIPSQQYGTFVQYIIYANDTDGNWAISDTYSYEVTDTIQPQIDSAQCTPLLEIRVNVSEPQDASGINTVSLHLRVDNDDWWNTTLVYDHTLGLWTRAIFGYNQLAGKSLEYFVEARDNAGNIIKSVTLNHNIENWRIADLNRDGKVDRIDLLLVAKNLRSASLLALTPLALGSAIYIKAKKRKKN